MCTNNMDEQVSFIVKNLTLQLAKFNMISQQILLEEIFQ
jgi:hypothetical protein